MSVTCVRGVSVDDRNNQIAGCAFAVLQAVLYPHRGQRRRHHRRAFAAKAKAGIAVRSVCPQRTGYNLTFVAQEGRLPYANWANGLFSNDILCSATA